MKQNQPLPRSWGATIVASLILLASPFLIFALSVYTVTNRLRCKKLKPDRFKHLALLCICIPLMVIITGNWDRALNFR